jgi:dihydrolipoamide dehydrogenase
VRYVRGRARFEDAGNLKVARAEGGEERVAFRHAIVATGSRPAPLRVVPAGSPRVMDSTSALEVESVPPRLLVIGGGYIGLELGSVYAALGSRVTLVEMTPSLLPGVDADLVRVLARRVERQLEAVLLETTVVGAEDGADGMRVRFQGKGLEGGTAEHVFDRVLVAVGRRPNSEELGLERTGVVVGERGFVAVDEQRRTAERSIYAIGDVASEPMLAHKASHEGRVAVEAIAGQRVAFEPAAIPAVVFTDPEIAWCGLTETQARARGAEVEIARFPWSASGRAATLGTNEGVTKLVIEAGTERVLGVGIAGSGAGELIAEGVLAVEMAARASDLALTIHAHPTLSETLMEAAEVFFGQSTHVHRPRRQAAAPAAAR